MDIEFDDLDMDVGAVVGEQDKATTLPGASASVVETVSPLLAVDTSPTFQKDWRDIQKLHEPFHTIGC